jgi:hypothetical protein
MQCIQNSEDARNACEMLSQHNFLGFDCEWNPPFMISRQKGQPPGKVATVQLSTRHQTFIFQLHILTNNGRNKVGSISALKDLLCNNNICFVGFNIQNDATKLFNDHQLHIKNLVDVNTLFNSRVPSQRHRWSLQSLTRRVLWMFLPKPDNVRIGGSWEVKHLSEEQKRYASSDALAALMIYDRIMADLIPRPPPPTNKSRALNEMDSDIVTDALLQRLSLPESCQIPHDLRDDMVHQFGEDIVKASEEPIGSTSAPCTESIPPQVFTMWHRLYFVYHSAHFFELEVCLYDLVGPYIISIANAQHMFHIL